MPVTLTCPTCKAAFTPKKYWQKFCCTPHQRLWYQTAQQFGVEIVQKGQNSKMIAEFEAMLQDNLVKENAKDPEEQRIAKEKRKAKKELRKERKKAEKKDGGELVQSGRTKKTAKNLRDKRIAASMDHKETWRSWIERNMPTVKEKDEFLQEHMKLKETFIDLDQRIGETNADFRERKRQEKV